MYNEIDMAYERVNRLRAEADRHREWRAARAGQPSWWSRVAGWWHLESGDRAPQRHRDS